MSRSFKDPMQKIVDAVAQRAADVLQFYKDIAIGSPIEAIMSAALRSEALCNDGIHSFDDIEVWQAPVGIEIIEQQDGKGQVCHVIPQVKILNYIADFVVYAPTPSGWSTLVVECDGHDFHERTKEQAAHDRARDRAMQEAGYKVFRFTGSEIYRDPIKCARQVITWAEKETFG